MFPGGGGLGPHCWPQAWGPRVPHGTSPCAGVPVASDSITLLSPSVSLWCGGHSLLQPADPPDMRAQESDLRLRHRLHHQRHAHRGQSGAAQWHEIGASWVLHLAHLVRCGATLHAHRRLQSSPSAGSLGQHHRVYFRVWMSRYPTSPASPALHGAWLWRAWCGSEDGPQTHLHPACAPPWPVCSTNSSLCLGAPGKLRRNLYRAQ